MLFFQEVVKRAENLSIKKNFFLESMYHYSFGNLHIAMVLIIKVRQIIFLFLPLSTCFSVSLDICQFTIGRYLMIFHRHLETESWQIERKRNKGSNRLVAVTVQARTQQSLESGQTKWTTHNIATNKRNVQSCCPNIFDRKQTLHNN